ncbi:MAG: redox-active protein [Desulfuromonas sp.]|nr:MAG: redox-active protein [Desulfuromonas sp.]
MNNIQNRELIRRRVAEYYWRDDINCATATLKILAEIFAVELHEQVIAAAVGMHGAGEYGCQCGLVEGALMFLGILGNQRQIAEERIVAACREFAEGFEMEFGSLECRVLRPEGFHPDNPPHICEPLSCAAIGFSVDFIATFASPSR